MSKEKALKKWDEVVLVPTSMLVQCEWNPNEMDDGEFTILCKEIAERGFDEPCQVVPIKDGDNSGKYLILGGHHRFKACIALGKKEIPCVIKTSLSEADEKELMLWAVKRNNIRGKINEQKYAKIEQTLSEKWSVSAEAARREMLIKGEMLKRLSRAPALEDNESIELSNDDDDLLDDEDSTPSMGEGESKRPEKPQRDRPATDGELDRKKKFADRRALLQALKAAEQEVLLESGDTAEHGYLFFGQGGGLHLVVNESQKLHELVSEMVSILKGNSERVDDFLTAALTNELPKWR